MKKCQVPYGGFFGLTLYARPLFEAAEKTVNLCCGPMFLDSDLSTFGIPCRRMLSLLNQLTVSRIDLTVISLGLQCKLRGFKELNRSVNRLPVAYSWLHYHIISYDNSWP